MLARGEGIKHVLCFKCGFSKTVLIKIYICLNIELCLVLVSCRDLQVFSFCCLLYYFILFYFILFIYFSGSSPQCLVLLLTNPILVVEITLGKLLIDRV